MPLFGGGGFSSARTQFTVRGPDLKRLAEVAEDATEKLKTKPGAVDVDSSLIVGKPEIGVYIDRARAADLGVQPSDVADALRLLVEGERVSNYEERAEEYEIHVRAQPKYRADEEGLRLLTVPSRAGPQHILIDCGVFGGKGNLHTLAPAVDDLARETGKKLALIIATHRHADHISGFSTVSCWTACGKPARRWLMRPLIRFIQ